MKHKSWYGQTILPLVLVFLSCSAIAVAPNASVWSRAAHDGAPVARPRLELSLAYDGTDEAGGQGIPTLVLRNVSGEDADVSIALHGPGEALISEEETSVAPGGHTSLPLTGLARRPAATYAVRLVSNQPITATIVTISVER